MRFWPAWGPHSLCTTKVPVVYEKLTSPSFRGMMLYTLDRFAFNMVAGVSWWLMCCVVGSFNRCYYIFCFLCLVLLCSVNGLISTCDNPYQDLLFDLGTMSMGKLLVHTLLFYMKQLVIHISLKLWLTDWEICSFLEAFIRTIIHILLLLIAFG